MGRHTITKRWNAAALPLVMALAAVLGLLFSTCGEVDETEVEVDEPDGLPPGYWETSCRCQRTGAYPGKLIEPAYRCQSRFKIASVCKDDDPFFCSTGVHWGWRCTELE